MRRLLPVLLLALLLVPLSARADTFTVTRNVSYGTSPYQVMDVFVPDTGTNLPAIVTIHGGAWDGGDKSGLEANAASWASRGLVVFNINYRLGSTYPWSDEETDVYFAFKYARDHAATFHADPSRFGLFGFSAGAHLAMVEAYIRPQNIKALAEWSGPWNLTQLVTEQGCPYSPCAFNAQYAAFKAQKFLGWCHLNGCYPNPNNLQPPVSDCAPSCSARYLNFSPNGYLNAGDPPTFIAHHSNDTIVPYSQGTSLRDALLGLNIFVEFHTKIDVMSPHSFSGDQEIVDMTGTFFLARL